VKFNTKAIHAGSQIDENTGAICQPIFQTSTFRQDDFGVYNGYDYSRAGNPTRTALEENLAALENAKFGHVFSSGMAATQALMILLKTGDHVVCTDGAYGGTYRFFKEIMSPWGLKVDFIDTSDRKTVMDSINEQTKLIYLESPTNPMMNVSDIEAIAKIAKNAGITLVVDNTFSSPYFQNPLDLGADIVLHSCTKYLGGHSDLLMGAIMTNDAEISESIAYSQKCSGAVPPPIDCFLLLRSTKTLGIRMEKHYENALRVAIMLEEHPQVKLVYYPGLKSHPHHDLAFHQMSGFGGMLSFEMESLEKSHQLVKNLKIITLAESLGGVESLINHPVSMTHSSVPEEQRLAYGLTDSLLRLSVGIEDIDDLLNDLKQAMINL
jgi:cystathionine gamma-lyase